MRVYSWVWRGSSFGCGQSGQGKSWRKALPRLKMNATEEELQMIDSYSDIEVTVLERVAAIRESCGRGVQDCY